MSYPYRSLAHPRLHSLPSSMPLIIPDDCRYDFSTNELRPIPSARRSQLKVVSETLELLQTIRQPLAVLAICGQCRSGKSYVLSRMLDSGDAFELGHTMDSKTVGIWIGTKVVEFEDFTLLLMDTEGIDAVNATKKKDRSILVLTALLSSYLIYNSKKVPRQSDLDNMSNFCQLARSVVVKQRGCSSTDELQQHFPDFLWLLRDVTSRFPCGEDGKEMSPTQYIMTKVLSCTGPTMDTRSETARTILQVFPNITCKAIQPPTDDPAVLENIAANEHRLNPKFKEQVQELVEYLCENVHPKKGGDTAKFVDGLILAEMTTQYVESVNDPDAILCIGDTWETAVKVKCNVVMQELLRGYDQGMERAVSEYYDPLEEDRSEEKDPKKPTLFELHDRVLQQVLLSLSKRLEHFVPATSTFNREVLSTELSEKAAKFSEHQRYSVFDGELPSKRKVIGGLLEKHARKNHAKSSERCQCLFRDVYNEIVKNKLSQARIANYTFETFQRDVREMYMNHPNPAQGALGPAKLEVYEQQASMILQEQNFRHIFLLREQIVHGARQNADAKAELDKLEQEMRSLKRQMERDRQLHQRHLVRQQQEHEIEKKKILAQHHRKILQDRQRHQRELRSRLERALQILSEML